MKVEVQVSVFGDESGSIVLTARGEVKPEELKKFQECQSALLGMIMEDEKGDDK